MPDKTVKDHEVAEAAYLMWLQEGKPDGKSDEHWHRAKALLEARETFEAAPVKKPRAKPAPKKAAAEAAPAPKATKAPKPAVEKPAAKPRVRKPKAG